MNWYDINTTMVYTEYGLKQCGLPLDADVLRLAGIFPVSYPYPSYDERLYTLEPSGKPRPKSDALQCYVQDFTVVPLPLETAKTNIKTAITQKRWQVETGGVTLPDGTVVLTGIEDQNRVATAIQGMRDSGMLEVDFKAESGWVSLTLDQLVAVSTAIAEHVQKCFSYERFLHELVDVCDSVVAIQTVDSNSDWPEPQIDGNKTSTGERT